MTYPYTAPDGTIIDSKQHLDKTLADEYRDHVMPEIQAVLDRHATRISVELGCNADAQANAVLEAMQQLTAEWIAGSRLQSVNDAFVDMALNVLLELRNAIPDEVRLGDPAIITQTYAGRTTYPFDMEVQFGPKKDAILARIPIPPEEMARRLGQNLPAGDPMWRQILDHTAAVAARRVQPSGGATLRGYDPATTQVWVDGHLCDARPIGTPEDHARMAEPAPPADIRTKTINQLREEYGLGRIEGGERLWAVIDQGSQPVNDDGQTVTITNSAPADIHIIPRGQYYPLAESPDDESPEPEQTEEPQS